MIVSDANFGRHMVAQTDTRQKVAPTTVKRMRGLTKNLERKIVKQKRASGRRRSGRLPARKGVPGTKLQSCRERVRTIGARYTAVFCARRPAPRSLRVSRESPMSISRTNHWSGVSALLGLTGWDWGRARRPAVGKTAQSEFIGK